MVKKIGQVKMKTIILKDGTKIKSDSNWIEYKTGRRNESLIGKRFYTRLDMAIIKKDQASRNGQIKRGEVKRYGNEYISVCGCGTEGCFIHSGYESTIKPQLIKDTVKETKENKDTIKRIGFDFKTSFKN